MKKKQTGQELLIVLVIKKSAMQKMDNICEMGGIYMQGKELLETFMKIVPCLPQIMGMEDNVVIWATDREKYTYMSVPQTSKWNDFNTKAGDKIRAGVGPVVLSTKKPYHGVIPSEVFGITLKAAAYPIIEGDEILGVIGITFGMQEEDNISEMAAELSRMCIQFKYR